MFKKKCLNVATPLTSWTIFKISRKIKHILKRVNLFQNVFCFQNSVFKSKLDFNFNFLPKSTSLPTICKTASVNNGDRTFCPFHQIQIAFDSAIVSDATHKLFSSMTSNVARKWTFIRCTRIYGRLLKTFLSTSSRSFLQS